MTKQDIRSDLHEIRYYYTHREMFEKAGVTVIQSNVLEKIKRYAQAVAYAPIRLYMLYIKLYTENNTQLSLAENMGYSEGYIKILNKQLVEYLFAYFTNLEKEDKADDADHS